VVKVLLLIVPIVTKSELNERGHWSARAKRFAAQRKTVAWAFLASGVRKGKTPIPATVTLTRLGLRDLDNDNLAGAMKAVRDEVAAMLAVDDADPRLTWVYGQERVKLARDAGVRIEIVSAEGAELPHLPQGELWGGSR
jgi:hypothetical protein